MLLDLSKIARIAAHQMSSLLVVLLLINALANWQAVETYHHSALFGSCRAYLETRGGFWADLTACPYCLSHWTALILTGITMVLAQLVCGAPAGWWFILPAFSLAVTRLSNLANDLAHPYCRTPRLNQVDNLQPPKES